ncbi:hypothetical protein SAMN05216391_101109 [Lachnospiraceae bacterium KHCPX20]|nr:hypothetical protein SAMN05216391_101109 [Lachnospiraceae bacterium KHCPX20]
MRHKGYNKQSDYRQITAYLIRYISGFRDNWRALDLDWVFHLGSGIHLDRNPYPNLDIMQLVGFNDYHDESTWDYRIIVPKVLEDLIAYLHRQLIENVNNKGFLDQQNDWELLTIPEYYAVNYGQESDWTILRYE